MKTKKKAAKKPRKKVGAEVLWKGWAHKGHIGVGGVALGLEKTGDFSHVESPDDLVPVALVRRKAKR